MKDYENVNDVLMYLKLAWENAGEHLRTKYMSELMNIPLPQKYTNGGDESYCVNFSNDFYDHGNHCVYVWVTEKGELFYVGEGEKKRCTNTTNRTDKFLIKGMSNDLCKVYVLASFVRKHIAKRIESLVIMMAQLKGWNLTNSSEILSTEELSQLKENSESNVTKKFNELVALYPEVVSNFKALNSYLLSQILTDEGKIQDRDYMRSIGREKKDTRTRWIIDKDQPAQLATYWCKKYEIDRATVAARMKKGLTLKEALTFPKIPYGVVGQGCVFSTAIEYWKSLGLSVGVDHTATIVNEISKESY